ncbi:MAG: glycosyltransferase [Leptospirillum sp.]
MNGERNRMISCPVCFTGESRHYANIDGITYYQCDFCRSFYVDPSILSSIDEGMTPGPYDEDYWKTDRGSACLRAKGGACIRAGEAILYARRPVYRFLDIGAGGGYLLDELVVLFPEEKNLFYEIEFFPPKNHSGHKNFKIETVASLEGKFDAGVCIDVLGHLTPKMLDHLVRDIAEKSEVDSLWLFDSGMTDFVVQEKNPGYLDPLNRGHIVSYSLLGLRPIFEKHGFKIQGCPGKPFVFIAEYKSSDEIPIEQRIYQPIEYNKNLLAKSPLLYQASFESGRSYYYFLEDLERTNWTESLGKELLENKSTHSRFETRFKRALAERDIQIQSLTQQLNAITSSKTWIVTQHLRKFTGKMPSSLKHEIWKVARSLFRFFRRGWHLFRGCFHIQDAFHRLGNNLIRILLAGNRKKYFVILYRRIESMPILGPVLRKMYARYKTRIDNYQVWIQNYDTLSDSDRDILNKAIKKFAHNPLISVILPVYNTPKEWLVKAIESVRNQIYPHWELCISDDASTLPHIKIVLDEYSRIDSRIHVVYRETNGHISANSNTALTLASGEFITLLDSDDELPEHALFWVAHEINRYPNVDLIYSDEDKISEEGIRFSPYFKPDWNPALMLSQNTFSHLGVYRRSLVEEVGGFRLGFEGSQDWDLVLRCSEKTHPERIRHIPRILYHWRTIPGSTAVSTNEKPYAWMAGKRAIEEYLARTGAPSVIRISPGAGGAHHQVSYSIDYHKLPPVSIIMPSACKLSILKPCLETLLSKTDYRDFEVLVIVNEIRYSVPEQADFLNTISADSRVRILVYPDQPFNYSKLNNWAIRQSTGATLCLMNDDIEVISGDWLEKLVGRLSLPGVGAVGPMLLYPGDRIQHAGVILGLRGVAGHQFQLLPKGHGGYFSRAALEQDLSCVTAACMVLKMELFEKVGGFNERLAIAFNDVDLCIRIRQASARILWTPEVMLYHHESASIGKHDSPERDELFRYEVRLMRTMWGEILDRDPFYNPNLSFDTYYHNLAFPPRITKLPDVDNLNFQKVNSI